MIFKMLSSFALTAVLLFIFAIGSGFATFIENDYGAVTAKALVYNALWFESVMILLAINLMAIAVKMQMWKKPLILILHSSFIMILIGAGITHFFGFEGVMHIRDGNKSNEILSAQSYISISDGNTSIEFPVRFSPISSSFNKNVELNGKNVGIELKQFIPNAIKSIKEDKNGSGVVSLMVANNSQKPEQFVLQDKESASAFGLTFGFTPNADVKFIVDSGKVFAISDKKIKVANLADDTTIDIKPKEPVELTRGKLYTVDDVRFVPKAAYAYGSVELASRGFKGGESALILNIKSDNNNTIVNVFGKEGEVGKDASVFIDDKKYNIAYGSKPLILPFAIKLEKFELLRYPGSMSPSSFASYVKVEDGANSFDYKIYMNHVLDYDGYRFFQSSYDMDEMGTILSVSKDPGKIPTYIGYLILGIGVFASFLNPKGRLWQLGRKLIAPAFALFIFVYGQNSWASEQNASMQINDLFGQVLVQDSGGRIKPMQTLAIDIVDKLSGSANPQTASGVVFSMIAFPKEWERQEIIKVSNPKLRELLEMKDGQVKASFADGFTKDMQYKLSNAVEEANRKPPAQRDMFDKEVLKVDERFNVCMMIFTGQFLKIFPKPNDPNNTWLDPQSALTAMPKDVSEKAFLALQELFGGYENGNLQTVEKACADIAKIQQSYGGNILPSQDKVNAELFYNNAQIFKRLIFVYLVAGLILFATQITQSTKPIAKKLSLAVFSFMFIAFVVQTLTLMLRWYISGHAPWSDGYESMIYISWSAMFAGLIFYRFLPLALAMTGLLAASMLMTAHLGFMDPQITNIVPVLKSYWLNIHVSLITASYGFFGLGFFLGILSLLLFVARSKEAPQRDELIKKIAIVNEMSLIVGLGLLTIGNFLGGVWANESWGRYWGWDPKETWALVSILVYAIVVHYRFIPGLKGVFAFSTMSVFGFASILMTYFGVNYYLSGMHSYASGDPVPVPWFVWVSIVFVVVLFMAAAQKRDLK